jgi:flavin reductase (DIM6/NTAB) family NADH-FMN oxidoreductase RutF
MTKKIFTDQTALPKPVVLVGANIDGKPNFLTVALDGFICGEPPVIAVGIRPSRYTLKGILQNMTFSVNVPSADMIEATDYCGIFSGEKTDKVVDCGFKVFYSSLATAPLIEQCPVNLECEVMSIIKLGSHDAIMGKVVETLISESCLTEGEPDITKINPVAFSREKPAKYFAMGEFIGQAFNIGLDFKKETGS